MRAACNITAHAGCDNTPDDSLDSIIAGIRAGADAVEVDVRLSANNVPVLSHNRDPEACYASSRTLEEAFSLIASNKSIAVNCDIKETAAIFTVLDLAEKAGIGADRLILTGCAGPAFLKKNPSVLKRASVWLNLSEAETALGQIHGPGEIVSLCLDLGIQVLNMPYAAFDSLIDPMRKQGLASSVWTVNEEDKLARFLSLGVHNITTRFASLAVRIREAAAGGR